MSIENTSAADYLQRTTSFGNSTPCTIALWFRVTAPADGNYHTIWDGGGGTDSPEMIIVPGGQLHFLYGAGAGDLLVVNPIVANTWYWVAFVFNGSTNAPVIFIGTGGALTKLTGAGTAGNWGGTTLRLMNNADDDFLGGQATFFKIWNGTTGALSDDEIANEYLKFAPSKTTDLYSSLPMLNSAGSGIDQSGNGNDFTATGTPATSRAMPPIPWIAEP